MSKRILSMVLMLTLVLGSFSMAFADTNATAALTPQEKIERLQELGYIEGHEDGDLRLDEEISRAQTAVITAKALYAGGNKDMDQVKAEIEKLNYKSSFKDVAQTNWANPYINVAAQKEVIHGFPDNTFKPARKVQYREVITMMVGLIGEEPNAGKYPGNYITKAMELGLLDGLNIADYEDNATRQDVFEILFNAVTDNKVGNYNIDKVIVLENDRVESIGKNEIVVEVMRQVQRANYVDDSRDNEETRRGEQLRITIPASSKLDVEGLLGKVVNLSYDKNNEAIAAEVDSSYRYESGKLSLDTNKLTVDGKTYTVSKAERYTDSKKYNDERIFNTYINNEPFTYSNAVTAKGVEFGKVTIKNGKVLFIDAFAFDDIAPVKEDVKKDGSKTIVTAYNDVNDGGEKKFELKDEKVIAYKDGSFTKMDKDDIKKLDVIHVGTDSRNKQAVIVRQDARVDGTYEKVVEYKDGKVVVEVDGEEYPIRDEKAKRPVYSPDSKEFFRLDAGRASSVLKGFEKEKVTILKDVRGDLQYIGGEIEFGEVVGLLDRVVGKDARVLKNDNNTSDYVSTLDSKFDVIPGVATGHQSLQAFDRGDLVFTSVNKDEIEKMTLLSKVGAKGIEAEIDKGERYVTLGTGANEENIRIFDRTNIFVRNYDKDGNLTDMFATTIGNVRKNAGDDLKAIVITDEQYAKEVDSRYVYDSSSNIAHTIVFSDVNIDKEVDKKMAEVTNITNKYEQIEVKYADGTRGTFDVKKSTKAYDALTRTTNRVEAGDIVELHTDKKDNKSLLNIVREIPYNAEGRAVASYNEKTKELTLVGDTTKYYLTSETDNFVKGSLEEGKVVAFTSEKFGSDTLIDTIVERKLGVVPSDGKITVVNKDEQLILLDGKVLPLDSLVKLNKDGEIHIGKKAVAEALTVGDEVKIVSSNKDGFITEITVVKSAGQETPPSASAQAVINKIAALPAKANVTLANKTEVEAARADYDDLTAAQKAEVTNYARLTDAEAKIAELENVTGDKLEDVINVEESKIQTVLPTIAGSAIIKLKDLSIVDAEVTVNGQKAVYNSEFKTYDLDLGGTEVGMKYNVSVKIGDKTYSGEMIAK